MTRVITQKARAKINLALHIVGQRPDGYHLLDSLVVFADFGDTIQVKKAPERSDGNHILTLFGPFGGGLETGDDNLVLKAARLMNSDLPALDIHLSKNLPVASGIGGGSADAAATLSAISELLDIPLPNADEILRLGADVPVCLAGKTVLMSGIGEKLEVLPTCPALHMVLVNPNVGVSTPAIFKALASKNNPKMTSLTEASFGDAQTFASWILENRNDLQAVAVQLEPSIQECLTALHRCDDCLAARMSGSGATCFGLFESKENATAAAQKIASNHPDWWVISAPMHHEQ